MTKAISLENLQQFKNKCDETYAPIGGGGGGGDIAVTFSDNVDSVTYLAKDGTTKTVGKGTYTDIAIITEITTSSVSTGGVTGFIGLLQDLGEITISIKRQFMTGSGKMCIPLASCTITGDVSGGTNPAP